MQQENSTSTDNIQRNENSFCKRNKRVKNDNSYETLAIVNQRTPYLLYISSPRSAMECTTGRGFDFKISCEKENSNLFFLLFLQQITDFSQKNFFLAWSWRCRRCCLFSILFLLAVSYFHQSTHHQEYTESYNEEIKTCL